MTIGVIFDLDGVLVDTAEYHYRAWQALADRIGVPFDRQANEALRGVDRMTSLIRLLGDHAARFSEDERRAFCTEKNAAYVRLIADITPADLLPGAETLLRALRAAGIATAVASASKNARQVLDNLCIDALLNAVADGNDTAKSKPDPAVFLLAAARLGLPPRQCVVVEDARDGVEAALAGGFTAIGIGDPARVGAAHRVCPSVAEIDVAMVQALMTAAISQ